MDTNTATDGKHHRSRTLSRTISDSGRLHFGSLITCYVTQADNQVLRVEVSHKADGKDLLDQVCRLLGITEEADYFGIQFVKSKREVLWLNCRNRISKQLHGSPPYHVEFNVKYFVAPYSLQLEETRHQFYINVVNRLKIGLWNAALSDEVQAKLIAIMAYVQFGKYNPNTTPCKYACFWPDCRGEIPSKVIRHASEQHRLLEGTAVTDAKCNLLRIAHELPLWGIHFYEVKDTLERKLLIGVGPQFIALCESTSSITERINHGQIYKVDILPSSVVTLNLLQDNGTIKSRKFQLSTNRLANDLYRSMTEVHTFFHTASVPADLLSQTLRDAFLFHVAKGFAFDVTSTSREVYERTRRRTYHATNATKSPDSQGSPSSPFICPTPDTSFVSSILNGGDDARFLYSGDDTTKASASCSGEAYVTRAERVFGGVSQEVLKLVEEQVEKRLQERLNCIICRVLPVSHIFLPCAHVICCAECAERVGCECPVCRSPIEIRKACFLPWNIDPLADDLQTDSRSSFCSSRRQSDLPRLRSTTEQREPSMLQHTESAPICTLFSPPSTSCLTAPNLCQALEEEETTMSVDSDEQPVTTKFTENVPAEPGNVASTSTTSTTFHISDEPCTPVTSLSKLELQRT